MTCLPSLGASRYQTACVKVHLAADIDTQSRPENISATGHRNAWFCVIVFGGRSCIITHPDRHIIHCTCNVLTAWGLQLAKGWATMHDHLTASAAPCMACMETRDIFLFCFTKLQVIDPSHPQPMDQPQATARSDSSYLAQDYREQPDEDQASSSDDGMDDQVSELEAEEAISEDEDGGPSTWLEDPPKGEQAINAG